MSKANQRLPIPDALLLGGKAKPLKAKKAKEKFVDEVSIVASVLPSFFGIS